MKIQDFAVVGHPIGHTMSPFIHRALFSLSGFAPRYRVLDIAELSESVKLLRELDGFNITIPHKMAVIPLLDDLDPMAARVGSVNTVRVEGGRMTGYTTDGAGCLEALALHGVTAAQRVLLLGCGGAARAVAFALAGQNPGVRLTLAARSLEKAQVLADDLGLHAQVLPFDALEGEGLEYDLLVNTTPVGMYPQGGQSPVSDAVVSRCQNIFDAVYNPHRTRLMEQGESLGKNLIYGIEMLVLQAAAAHTLWYGARFAPPQLQALCKQAAAETAKVFGQRDDEE